MTDQIYSKTWIKTRVLDGNLKINEMQLMQFEQKQEPHTHAPSLNTLIWTPEIRKLQAIQTAHNKFNPPHWEEQSTPWHELNEAKLAFIYIWSV